MKKIVIVLIGLLSLCLISISTLKAGPQETFRNALWIAETKGVLKIATESGAILLELSAYPDIQSLAVDARRRLLQGYGNGSLYTFDLNGVLQQTLPVTTVVLAESSIAVADFDGSVWLSVHDHLYEIAGNLVLNDIPIDKIVRAISIDNTNHVVWVGLADEVRSYAASGAAQLSVAVPNGDIKDVSYDHGLNELWVAGASGVRRFNNAGNQTLFVSYPGAANIEDDDNGQAWFATSNTLYLMQSSGAVLVTVDPFSGSANAAIQELAVDRSDVSVWVASQKTVKQFFQSGASGQEVPILNSEIKAHVRSVGNRRTSRTI